MSNSALSIVSDASRAKTIVDDLRAVGFPREDISVVFPDRPGARELAFGWLGGVGILALPGIGSYLASGPLLGNLHVFKNDPSHVVSRALASMGLSAFEAKQYENRLRAGQTMISVLVDGAVETTRAIEIFERHRAESIGVAEESNSQATS